MQEAPQILVTTKQSDRPCILQFENIFGVKQDVTTIQLMFSNNAYELNVKDRCFTINSGHKRHRFDLDFIEASLVCIRRQRLDIIPSTGESRQTTTYLLGLEGTAPSGDRQQILLHIYDNGQHWYWRNSR